MQQSSFRGNMLSPAVNQLINPSPNAVSQECDPRPLRRFADNTSTWMPGAALPSSLKHPGELSRGARPLRSVRCSRRSFVAEREYAFRLVDGILGTGFRVAQKSLCSTRMRLYARIAARHGLPESRHNHFFSEGDE